MEWRRAELGQVAEIRGGATPRRDNSAYWGGDIPWLTPTDLPANGAGITEVAATRDYITEDGLASCSASLLPPGAVLFSSRASIGKVGIASVPLTTNQGFANFIPRPGVDSRYLAWCLHFYAQRIASLAGSTTFKEVSKGALRRFRIPLPPFSEQRRIVEILDQADRLRRLRAEADAKAERILPALFIKMFGDPATNPMGWPLVPLGELSVLGPQYGANARSVPLQPGAPRYIRITDILDDGRLSEDEVGIDLGAWKAYRLEEGDLLFARSGATVGKTYVHHIVQHPCVFAGYLIRFRLDCTRLHPLVAFAFTKTTAYRAWVESKRRTAAQPNINGQEYSRLPVPVPDSHLQVRFVDAYQVLQGIHNRSGTLSRQLSTLFSLLLAFAFDGSLTASWREAHMKELLQEMEHQARMLETATA